ncbi:Zn-dependent hydrolase, glyoxylase [Burkholderiales bacterium JOSHI_001]|nr:Zn-dependent hydrolase, glyoxylase [Burkholderiales bacterium JOSHI_001]
MTAPAVPPPDSLAGLTVLQRGWLSSNNILVHAATDEPGALLIDASHSNHAEQTVALVRQALGGQPLALLVNTHLHSDHCGGNAALQAAFGMPVAVPPGQAQAVADWDASELTYDATGQRCDRFAHQRVLAIGEVLRAGGRDWCVLAAPGHDPHSVILFDSTQGVLVSADALWENGFGVVFPELEGEPGFDDVAAVLDLMEGLAPRCVIPGHGAPFTDVAGALQRARIRLKGMRDAPQRHARHAAKVLVKYHLMEVRQQGWDAVLDWAEATPLLQAVARRFGPGDAALRDWAATLTRELLDQGALELRDGVLLDR